MSNSNSRPPTIHSDDPHGVTDAARPLTWSNLPETLQKMEARVTWKDRNGTHDVTVTTKATIGSAANVEISIADSTVSHLHLEIEPRQEGVYFRDLGSRNGTYCKDIQVWEFMVRDGTRVRVGTTELLIHQSPAAAETPLWPAAEFGPLLGRSSQMRDLFRTLAEYARSEATVFIHGETGTGKELVARALHEESSRKDGPFIIVDCGAMPGGMLEAELFGHARGAFTGADTDRQGAFMAANGGTLFLDEIGELPLPVQPKLLRMLESRTVRRLGETAYREADVRFVCASHRDLRRMVNQGTLREDLYFRLAVLVAEVPPLRARTEDIVTLLERFLPELKPGTIDPRVIMELMRRPWEGNVRQLRNFAERVRAMDWQRALDQFESAPDEPVAASAKTGTDYPPGVGVVEGRKALVEAWERGYWRALLARHNGDVAAAALEAQVSKSMAYRAIRELGV